MTNTMTNTLREHLQRYLILLTFETYDQIDEKTGPGQQKDNEKRQIQRQ